MASVEYDLDTAGGLMEEIQKLTAPPVSEDLARKQRRQDRERRRHGRAINHDCCDSCKEGGDLLCCDRCPAAFHLQCHDPPLEEDELPPGEWICHRCRISPPEPDEEDSSCIAMKTGTKSRPKRQNSKEDEKEHPLQMLAKAAKLINPVQFELTKDIACTTPLPGSSKRRPGVRASTKKLPHEHDNGIVPLPAKVCFMCSKSCRVSPLIQCDYCPLLFHQDCLNPPLTSLPTGRWMCPNHVENAMDEKLLHSLGLHERIKLWDRFSGQVDQHAVKIKFLRQGHRRHPPFRLKKKLPGRKTITIPPAIKQHYINPPSLLPMAASGTYASLESSAPREQGEISLEEQEEWLTAVVSLQTSIARFLAQKQLHKATESAKTADSGKSDHCKPTASVAPVVHRDCDMHEHEDSVEEHISSASKMETSDCDRTSLNGSAVCSPVQEAFSNGPFEMSKGSAVSLLHGTSSATVNGDIDFVNLQRTKPDAVVIRTRSNSADSPIPNIVKVNWPPGEKPCASSSSGGLVTNTQGKNIVISAIKSNNTVVTKVLPHSNPGGKSVSTNSAAKNIIGSNPTSILSPRLPVQPAVKLATSGSQSKCTVSHAMGTISSPKVITVSASPSGGKLGSGSISTTQGKGGNLGNSNSTIINLNNTLQQFIEGNTESELSKIDEKLIQILAWQRLQQLTSDKSDMLPNKRGVLNGLLQQSSDDGSCEVRARAVLCPLTGKGQAIPMPYRTMGIGTGADMDVCLNQFGHCNFVSPKHACIFYDEMTKHYELLNYSEHGTTVDNVLYSCDFSDKPATTPQPSPVVAAVRNVISKAKQKLEDEEQKRLTMTAKANDNSRHCNCRVSSSSLIGGSGAGWEGTALLHHGSYIKVGCLQFVFSIVDQAASEPIIERRSESISLLKTHLKAAQ